MVAEGSFPFPGGLEGLDSSPRAGDGLVRLDVDGLVTYASPNALSAYRRLGLAADLTGVRLDTVTRQLVPRRGPVDEDLVAVAGGRTARGVEVEGKGTIVQLRAIPVLAGGVRVAGIVLVRDVTEVRRRERELLTKDATIREIHHRVKNNLQTVAALLRLQARRTELPEARGALEEAVRRVGSIALVHELLSTTPDEAVPFDQVADRVLAMVAEVSTAGLPGPGNEIRPVRKGSFGVVPAEVATPLSVVLSEIVQNAVEHGLRRSAGHAGRGRRARGQRGCELRSSTTGAACPTGSTLRRQTGWACRSSAPWSRASWAAASCSSAGPRAVRARRSSSPSSPRRTHPLTNADARPRERAGRRSRWSVCLRQAIRARARAVRRLSARRSSSDRPPQTPAS